MNQPLDVQPDANLLTDAAIEELAHRIGQPGDIVALLTAIQPAHPGTPSPADTPENAMAQSIQALAINGPLTPSQVNAVLNQIHDLPTSWFWRTTLISILIPHVGNESKKLVSERLCEANKEDLRQKRAEKWQRTQARRQQQITRIKHRIGEAFQPVRSLWSTKKEDPAR